MSINSCEVFIGIILLIIAIFLLIWTCSVENNMNDYEKYCGKFDIRYGLWSPFGVLGMWITLDGYGIFDDIWKINFRREIINHIKWKMKNK